MATLERAALEVVRDLADLGRGCALVGGLAVAVRARPRTTLDVDFAVAVATDEEAEETINALQALGYRLFEVLEQTVAGRLATARFRRAGSGGASLDLLFASSGIEPEVVAAADEIEILPTSRLPVAQRGHLLALKVLAYDEVRRPQDRVDIVELMGVADRTDLGLAREAAALITERGFHRDKDLIAELERFAGLTEELRRERDG